MANKTNPWIIGGIILLLFFMSTSVENPETQSIFGGFSGCEGFNSFQFCVVPLETMCIEGICSGVDTIEQQAKAQCNLGFSVTSETCSKEVCFPEGCLSEPTITTGEHCAFEGCENLSGKIVECRSTGSIG